VVLNRLHPARLARSAAVRARGAAMSAGVLSYRPSDTATLEDWNREHAAGEVDYYDELHELGRYSMLIGYLRWLGDSPSILDLGCGVGLFRKKLNPLEFERYVGVDPAKNAIERTQPLVDDRTSFMVGAEPQGGELFDVVVCNEVLYVVPEADEMLAVAQRSLRPGGHLLTSIWSHPGDRALQRLIANRFDLRDAVDVENVVRPRKSRVACWQRRA
jgi:2-polyprenyl-6-hydroxyphenyl methylase/3-demethylubiquinone-9 3-methyltransferase